MKRTKYILFIGLASISSLFTSCVKDLLDLKPTVKVSSDLFWTSTDDALTATMGVYEATRTLFATDYYYDGMGEFQWTRGKSVGDIGNWSPAGWVTSGFSSMWNNSYRVINRANYVIYNIDQMILVEKGESVKKSLEQIKGENCFLRALAYFRLIENWGDVPFYTHVLSGDAEARSFSRTSITEIKDKILEDLTYATTTLPTSVSGNDLGRATQVAAYGFRGKVELYWASWKKYGWPELKGFTQDEDEAKTYYGKAAEDFHKVIYDYDLKLFGEGNPGSYQTPNYWELFQYYNEYCSEIIFSIQYGGPNMSQGESLMRDFGTRNTGNAQCWITPTSRLVDRYQSLTTGDFCPKLILSNNATIENGAINRGSYANRDWRMRATILWDGEKMLDLGNDGMTLKADSVPFKYKMNGTGGYIKYDIGGNMPGYIFRKWVRQAPVADRENGPQDFYLMRLADVFLMYSEATNEVSGPSAELVNLVNQIRKRGNLPGLTSTMSANKEAFFKAIEQERIVELVGEGHRPFDIRRWRKLHEIWGEEYSEGVVLNSTQGERVRDEFKNASEKEFEKYYIYQIPEGERSTNPNLTQNDPWL